MVECDRSKEHSHLLKLSLIVHCRIWGVGGATSYLSVFGNHTYCTKIHNRGRWRTLRYCGKESVKNNMCSWEHRCPFSASVLPCAWPHLCLILQLGGHGKAEHLTLMFCNNGTVQRTGFRFCTLFSRSICIVTQLIYSSHLKDF